MKHWRIHPEFNSHQSKDSNSWKTCLYITAFWSTGALTLGSQPWWRQRWCGLELLHVWSYWRSCLGSMLAYPKRWTWTSLSYFLAWVACHCLLQAGLRGSSHDIAMSSFMDLSSTAGFLYLSRNVFDKMVAIVVLNFHHLHQKYTQSLLKLMRMEVNKSSLFPALDDPTKDHTQRSSTQTWWMAFVLDP